MEKIKNYRHALRIMIAMMSLFALSSFSSLSAQPTQALTENWRRTDFNFNGKMLDTDVAGNAYVLGDNPATNVLNIRKYNAAGTLLWQTKYDDPVYNLSGVWIIVDSGGNAIVLANIVSSTDGQPSGWMTLKYDTNGNQLWVNPVSRASSNAARVSLDSSGNIYVAGTGVLTKYSPSGITLWQDATGAVGQPYSLAISIDGNRIAIAGKSGITGLDFRATMYDANGSRLWTNTTATPYPANDVAFRPNFDYETYFATGTYSPLDPNPNQMAIVKFDAVGNQTWLRSYSVGDSTYRLVATGDGIVAAGVDLAGGYMDWMTIKTDYAGIQLWSKRYDGAKTNDETPNMLVVDTFGGAIYVTGKGGPNPSSGTISNLKGVVVKYSSTGAPQWTVWDDMAGGKALRVAQVDFGMPSTVTTLGWGYLTTASYTITGLLDSVSSSPSNLTISLGYRLNFTDNATNEFWVEVERCAGSGCTNFSKLGQTRGENATSYDDTTTVAGTTYNYRVRALGFMGAFSLFKYS